MILTDIVLKKLSKEGRYTDGQTKGLHLWVKANQKKYWIFRFTLNNKRQNTSLGCYPEITLKSARQRAIKLRNEINQGDNPISQKKSLKSLSPNSNIPTFGQFSEDYIKVMRPKWSNEKHASQWINSLQTYAFPIIGNMQLDKIETEHIEKILIPIWNKKTVTANRVMNRIAKILSSAKTRKYLNGINPAIWKGHLDTILPAPNEIRRVKNHKALPYKDITQFMTLLRELDYVGALALEFTILNAARTGEVIHSLRSEINGNIWTIPPLRMKTKKEHRVPLGKRALEILEIAKSKDMDSLYLFSRNGKPLSGMAMPMMIRRLDIDVTVHGFRSTFRDWVSEETLHSPEVAEMALAHSIRNKVESAYRRGDLLERRRKLMEDWESYCLTGKWGNVLLFPEHKIS